MWFSLTSASVFIVWLVGTFQPVSSWRVYSQTACQAGSPLIRAADADSNGCSYKYRQCVHGVWQARPCGPNTLFDFEKQVCNHPWAIPGCGKVCDPAKGGQAVLAHGCTKQMVCVNGNLHFDRSFQCGANSECVNNKCECKSGFKLVRRNGLAVTCEAIMKDCVLANRKHMEIWLMNNCALKCDCYDGLISDYSYSCPANSRCQDNQCVCDDKYVATGHDQWGNLEGCTPVVKDCPHVNRKHMEVWLMLNCAARCDCYDGRVSDFPYKCPANSRCNHNNKCVCDDKYVAIGHDQWGNLEGCTPGINNEYCSTSSLIRAADADSNGCSNKYRQCVHGVWQTRSCGPNTLFDFDKQVCNHPWAIPGCNTQCHSGKSGEAHLSSQCTRKSTCVNENYHHDDGFQCGANSECVNNKCVCKSGFILDHQSGVEVTCIAPSRDCTLWNRKHTETWLMNDCRFKCHCNDGSVTDVLYSCPANSHCNHDNQCVCDDRYASTGCDKWGILFGCALK